MPRLRVILPVFLALLVAGGLFAGFFTYRNAALETFRRTRTQAGRWAADVGGGSLEDVLPAEGGDAALLRMREGDIAARNGEWKEAEEAYAAAVTSGGGVSALQKLAHAKLQRRDVKGAREQLTLLKRAGGRAEEILLLSVTIALHEGDTESAAGLLAAAGDSPQRHYAAGLLALLRGNHDEARAEWTATLEGWEPVLRASARILLDAEEEYALFPGSPQTHRDALLARALAQVQECPLALPFLQSATEQQDDYRDAWIVQGYCQLVTGQRDAALASFERAYTLDPQKPEIQYFLGRAYAERGDHLNAVTFLQYALANGFKPERDVRRLLSREAQAAGNLLLAFEQEKLLATASGSDLAGLRGFVDLALKAGRPDDALIAARQAAERWPEDARALELLGTAAAAADRKEEARAAYQRALDLDGSLENVKEKLLAL